MTSFSCALSCSVIEDPDILTLAYSQLSELSLVHVFTMVNTGRQLVEEFHDIFLSESEIFSSPGIVIVSAFKSHLESAPIQGMGYFSCLTKLESVALSYCIELN